MEYDAHITEVGEVADVADDGGGFFAWALRPGDC